MVSNPNELPGKALWGQTFEQMPGALYAFDLLFAEFQPKRILEWGTGAGGFTIYLAVWAQLLQAELLTVDNKIREGVPDFFARVHGLPVQFRQVDYYEDPWLAGLGWLIPRAPSLFLLDGAVDKGKLLKFGAPFLKSGDVLMVHDYVPPDDDTAKLSQVPQPDIKLVCQEHGYVPFMQKMFDAYQSHWLCLRKQ